MTETTPISRYLALWSHVSEDAHPPDWERLDVRFFDSAEDAMASVKVE